MSAAEWAGLIAPFLLVWCLALSPLLVPLFVVIRWGRNVPLRWLFVFLAAISSYGILGLLAALIWLPMDFLVSTVAPQLPDEAPAIAAWLNPVLNYIHTWMRTWLHLVAVLLMVV